jgi:hypothetical protein
VKSAHKDVVAPGCFRRAHADGRLRSVCAALAHQDVSTPGRHDRHVSLAHAPTIAILASDGAGVRTADGLQGTAPMLRRTTHGKTSFRAQRGSAPRPPLSDQGGRGVG